MKKKNIIPLLFTAATVVFEILPYGAKLEFGLDNSEIKEELFSYFSLTPYGYANFLPFITAVLTCVLLILAVIIFVKDSPKCKRMFKMLVIGVFCLASVSFAVFNFTVTAALISLMIASAWLSAQLIYKA